MPQPSWRRSARLLLHHSSLLSPLFLSSHLSHQALPFFSSDSDLSSSDGSNFDFPSPSLGSNHFPARNGCYYPVRELGSSQSLDRRYSFSKGWSFKRDMERRVGFALSNRGWDLSSLNSLEINLDEHNVTRMLNDLYDESYDAALAFYFFRWSQRTNQSRHGILVVCTMTHISVLGNMNHIAVNLLRDIVMESEEWHGLVLDMLRDTSRDRRTLETVCSMLVSCYVEGGMIDGAIRSLEWMKKFGFFPTTGVYVTLLKMLLESKQLEAAWEVFTGMPDWVDGSTTSEVIVSLFIRQFCTHGDFFGAYSLILHMENNGGIVDVVAYTIIIDSLCKNGLWKEATALFYKMIKMGICPDSVLLSSICNAYCKLGKLAEAMVLLNLSGLVPDVFMYDSFIHKLCKDGNVEGAYELFIEMFNLGIDPDSFNYATIIGGFCKSCQMDQVLKTVTQMIKRGCRPTTLTYTILIEGYCKIGDLQGAEYIFNAAKIEGQRPDVFTYNALINGYSQNGFMHMAYEVKDMMTKDGISADGVTYNILMYGLVKWGFVMESRELFDELVRRGFTPDRIAFTNLIHGYSKQGKLEEAYLIWCSMSESGIKPDVITCSALLNGFCKTHRMQDTNMLFHKMLESGLEPDLTLYNTLLRGFCCEGNIGEAFQLLQRMAEDDIYPDDFTYHILVTGLENAGVENPVETAAMKLQLVFPKRWENCR